MTTAEGMPHLVGVRTYHPSSTARSVAIAQQEQMLFKQQQNVNAQEEVNTECKDGKDDGKIGFFEKIGSAVKGIFKGIGNGIKGLFTNKEGKFSLFKTLGSAALIAGSIMCPALGAGLCAVGVAKGAVGVIKNASAAGKATTDAEAKQAWEGIGASGATAVASAYGLKASVGAIAAKGATATSAALPAKASAGTSSKALAASTETGLSTSVAKASAASGKFVNTTAVEVAPTSTGFFSKVASKFSNIRQGIKENGFRETIGSEAKAIRQAASNKYHNIKGEVETYGIKDTVGFRTNGFQNQVIQKGKGYMNAIKGVKNGIREDGFKATAKSYAGKAADFGESIYNSKYVNTNPKLEASTIFPATSYTLQQDQEY